MRIVVTGKAFAYINHLNADRPSSPPTLTLIGPSSSHFGVAETRGRNTVI